MRLPRAPYANGHLSFPPAPSTGLVLLIRPTAITYRTTFITLRAFFRLDGAGFGVENAQRLAVSDALAGGRSHSRLLEMQRRSR